ncbi:hypothetical protein DERP_005494 [Dermatophagoides pteronyssinus]|uniref:Uncharacterized protein n=1 Tax=Dermatophagoides pteronyssinus TaxID=6956 RepID=A0ABQ8JMR0_DERPT|nr:hypothetical protein DERP_005494 [Dermatophagoides pteronyssinus]
MSFRRFFFLGLNEYDSFNNDVSFMNLLLVIYVEKNVELYWLVLLLFAVVIDRLLFLLLLLPVLFIIVFEFCSFNELIFAIIVLSFEFENIVGFDDDDDDNTVLLLILIREIESKFLLIFRLIIAINVKFGSLSSSSPELIDCLLSIIIVDSLSITFESFTVEQLFPSLFDSTFWQTSSSHNN